MLHSSQFLTVSLHKYNWIFAKHNWSSSSDISSVWIQKHLITLDIQAYSFTSFKWSFLWILKWMRPWIELCLLVKKFAFMHESQLQIETLCLCDKSVFVSCYFVIGMVKYLTRKNSDCTDCKPIQDDCHIFTCYWRCCLWLVSISIISLANCLADCLSFMSVLFLCIVTYTYIIFSTCRTVEAILERLEKICNVSVWCVACSFDN
jgi:hypothetical protein